MNANQIATRICESSGSQSVVEPLWKSPLRVCLGYVYAPRRRPLASNRIYPAALSVLVVHRLLYSRATPYSTWQDDFSYDKYSDRAAVHSRRSAADANNIRRRRDGVVNMRERGQ